MPDHRRKSIRAAIAAAVTGLTSTAARVHVGRRYPIQGAGLPCICVYTGPEASERGSMSGQLERQVEFVINAITKEGDEDLDDELDALALQIETAMNSADFSAHALDVLLVGTDPIRPEEGDRPYGGIQLRYQVIYETGDTA